MLIHANLTTQLKWQVSLSCINSWSKLLGAWDRSAHFPLIHYTAFLAERRKKMFTGRLLSSTGKCAFSWWVVKLTWCSIDEYSSRVSLDLIISRMQIVLFSLVGGREPDNDGEGTRVRRDAVWQREVSDGIFGAKAERLGANWVLWRLSQVLIGPHPAGSSSSLADRTTLSQRNTAQFKVCCWQRVVWLHVWIHTGVFGQCCVSSHT